MALRRQLEKIHNYRRLLTNKMLTLVHLCMESASPSHIDAATYCNYCKIIEVMVKRNVNCQDTGQISGFLCSSPMFS